jgi:ribosomal protein L29
MKTQEFREKKTEELQKLLTEKQTELQELKFAIKFSGETNVGKRKVLRKEIARISTILNEKEFEAVTTEIEKPAKKVKAEVKTKVEAKSKAVKKPAKVAKKASKSTKKL